MGRVSQRGAFVVRVFVKVKNKKSVKLFAFILRYTNAALKICQYICIHIKIMCCKFHIKSPFIF